MKKCLELATKQAKERKQFDQSISEFGLIKEKLGQMVIDCFAAESAVALLGHLIDSGSTDFSVEAACCKVFASEALWRTCNEALQVAGGIRLCKRLPL